ncbi:MAG: Gfo/Idh/MocA family oxidoreductase [Lachnospiraceae bacterium]|nr:Gfo/Idh/MocA family oxidoreductase [Lachnospiraceae bacterium]
MRAAIIGTGMIAGIHADAVRSCGGKTVLAVSRTLEGAQKFAGKYGITRYSDRLLPEDLEEVDAVYICTPPAAHLEYFRICAEAGKAVFCEKPLALSEADAEDICRIAEESGIFAAVGFNNRFYPAVNIMKERLAGIGEPVLVAGHYYQEFHILPCPYSWRYEDPLRAVSEIGSHYLDLVRYVTGLEIDPDSVTASFRTVKPERVVKDGIMYPADSAGEEDLLDDSRKITVSSEDIAVVSFSLENGALGNAVFSETAAGRSNDLAIEVFSGDSSIAWESEHSYQLKSGRYGEGVTTITDAFGGGFPETFRESAKVFMDSVRTGKRDPRLASLEDGLASVRLAEAIKEKASRRP